MDTSTKIVLGIGGALLIFIPTYNILSSIIVDAALIACVGLFLKWKLSK
jgi:hypothetical protein